MQEACGPPMTDVLRSRLVWTHCNLEVSLNLEAANARSARWSRYFVPNGTALFFLSLATKAVKRSFQETTALHHPRKTIFKKKITRETAAILTGISLSSLNLPTVSARTSSYWIKVRSHFAVSRPRCGTMRLFVRRKSIFTSFLARRIFFSCNAIIKRSRYINAEKYNSRTFLEPHF